MKYSFGTDKIVDPMNSNKTRDVAYISLDDHEKYGEFFIDEIRNLKLDYLKLIVSQLEKLQTVEISQYDFGFEVYNFDCTSEKCKVLNTLEGWKVECELPTEDIYRLLRDWRDYLINFETTKSS